MTVIDPSSYLSYDKIKENLMDYVKSLPDASSWVDFFESSSGQTVIELMAGLGSMYNIRIDHARRESYITEAKLKSSIYLIALALGYNPHRKFCPRTKIFIDIAPAATQVSIIKGENVVSTGTTYGVTNENVIIRKAFQLTNIETIDMVKAVSGVSNAYLDLATSGDIFSVANYVPEMKFEIKDSTSNNGIYTIKSISDTKLELVDSEDFINSESFIAGSNIVEAGHYPLDIIIGEWVSKTHSIVNAYDNYKYSLGSSDFEVASDITTDVDRNERLNYMSVVVNGSVSLKTTVKVEELDNPDEVLIMSNHLGDVDLAFGDGILGYRVATGDSAVVTYIKSPGLLLNLASIALSPVNADIQLVHNMSPADIYTYGQNEEESQKVRTLAPRYYSTLGRGVTFKDIEVITERFQYFQDTNLREAVDGAGNLIPVTLQLSYIMEPEEDINGDSQILSQALRDEFFEYYNLYRMAGTRMLLYDPTVRNVSFKFHIVYENGFDTIDLKNSIAAAIESHLLKLGGSVLVGTITKNLSSILGVNRIYTEYPYEDRSIGFSEYYKLDRLDTVFYSDQSALLKNYSATAPSESGYD